jgi:hypothetical protein
VIKAAVASGGSLGDPIGTRMTDLVKGRSVGADTDSQARTAENLFKGAISKGFANPAEVAKGLSPQFSASLGLAVGANPAAQAMSQFVNDLQTQLSAELGKNISLTSPLGSGLVPFDLVAPSRLIYPVYSPFRNMVPRVPGQGTSHRAKVISAVSGSLPGQLGKSANRISIPELVQGGGSLSNWPNNLPGSGSQSGYDMNIPYKFFGLTEAVSWLAQFAGQGFEDAAGLASLILLQEAMLLEEQAMISATSVAVATPATPGLTARAAGTGETAITSGTNLYVKVTALNFYGETAASTEASVAITANTSVVDVQITPVSGALAYGVYAATATGAEKLVKVVGGTRFTVQGVIPTGTAAAPTVDSGTSSSNDYEGFISAISGHSAGTVYPAGVEGSYVNGNVGDVMSGPVLEAALEAMWDGSNGVFADPDELWYEGSDATRLADNLTGANNGNTGYRLFIDQSQNNSVRGGVAVSEFVNPITRKVISLKVHPYLPQGTAMLMSWKLPMQWSNVGNVWENVMVQDYLSISWPVIDASFRYSLFWYGTLFCQAPQYNGLLQGIQKSTVANGGTYS